MRKSSPTIGRTTLSIPGPVQEAPRHPEYLGLPKNTSKAKIFQALLARGWSSVLAEQRAKAELEIYAAYEQDPERRAAAKELQEMTLRSGVV